LAKKELKAVPSQGKDTPPWMAAMNAETNTNPSAPLFLNALRFWERGRVVYNAALTVVVLLWIVITWPHFRPAMTLGSFEALIAIAFAANACYCAAYLADFFMQRLLPSQYWRRFRQVLWVLGMLFAILLENYWIADEIYDYVTQPPPSVFQGGHSMPGAPFLALPAREKWGFSPAVTTGLRLGG
jgi:hypothetical protein